MRDLESSHGKRCWQWEKEDPAFLPLGWALLTIIIL